MASENITLYIKGDRNVEVTVIRERYGSADAYLEAEYGLTPARLMRLRRMYLE